MTLEYVLYVTFFASKNCLQHPNGDASKNVSTSTVSEFYEILRANLISRGNSNGAICFVIRDLENKLRIFNRNYNFVTEITILPFFMKLEFLGSYTYISFQRKKNHVIILYYKQRCINLHGESIF